MSEHLINDPVLDGTPSGVAVLSPQIKLRASPYLFIAVPCGTKDDPIKVECPKELGGCGQTFMLEGHSALAMSSIPWIAAFKGLQLPMNVVSTLVWHHGSLSAKARQIMTKTSIAYGGVYTLYWDDDVLPDRMSIYTLLNFMNQNPHVGAVSGVYVTKMDPCEPYIYKEHGAGAAWDFELGPDAKPEPIFGAGAGFLMARNQAIVETIERMKAENGGKELPIWADETEIDTTEDGCKRQIIWGHDVRFCHQLNKTGWPVYVDGRVLCGHYDSLTGKVYNIPDTAPGFKLAAERMARNAKNADETTGSLPFVKVVPTDSEAESQGEEGTACGDNQGREQIGGQEQVQKTE